MAGLLLAPILAEFFAELAGFGVEALKDSGFFSEGYAIIIGIKNNLDKPWTLKYNTATRWEHEPPTSVAPGESVKVVVRPAEGWFNLNYHMETDFYYNKTDADQAFFRVHVVRNSWSSDEWGDTKEWNDCKLTVDTVPVDPGLLLVKIVVNPPDKAKL
ncbi:hypothetical protein LTR56_005634 [Elasticomyces elasticus]|nr:hypothetical protein LTR56_005634 [Elasticomyces elasticus]KAK3663979.1 hypothetical protein LTR22_005199 [Elasticomyces elasticus]KAK4927375.1 hypothetical protein LTR49_005780 [Elasticomyces elasticus]KAK5763340.1 hypothetical protein LTS12_006515 [Elasticomyces elasticus]